MKTRLAPLMAALLLSAIPASAEIREATYEVQGWCFQRADPVFDDALTGIVSSDAVTNTRPHIHTEWLIKDGVINSRDDLIGKCAVIYSQWVRGADGNMHQIAYVPKGHVGIDYTNGLADAQDAADNYFKRGDQEMAASTGCADVGSTKAGRGNSGGDCK